MFAFSVAIGIAVVLGGKPLAIGTAVGAIVTKLVIDWLNDK